MATEPTMNDEMTREESHNPTLELMSMFDQEENPSSSLSSPPEDAQSFNDNQQTHPAEANNDLVPSPAPLIQAPEETPHEVEGQVEVREPASPQPAQPEQPAVALLEAAEMSYQGIDLTAEAGESSTSVSWHEPHVHFAVIFVGPSEVPFAIQKDLLCAQSPYYRDHFAKLDQENTFEFIIKHPDFNLETFGCFQNFIYSGSIFDRSRRAIPEYPLLLDIWKLATFLRMAPLRISVLDVMNERRQQTASIPGTHLLIQAWKETEEGSGLRTMLITWAAEHMRASPEIRNAFAKSLPQEILSELVIVMSDLPSSPQVAPISFLPQPPQIHQPPAPQNFNPVSHNHDNMDIDVEPRAGPSPGSARPRPPPNPNKRPRKSEAGFSKDDDAFELKPPHVKKAARRSEPNGNRRKSKGQSSENMIPLSADKEMNFCRDLIVRMLSGPGFWTRLVGPFRNPVDPIADNVPNYLTVVKRPMDLLTIRDKMARGEYATAADFEADVRQIFQNCYEYWTEKDAIFDTCIKFERYFNEKWDTRHKWVPGTIKSENAE